MPDRGQTAAATLADAYAREYPGELVEDLDQLPIETVTRFLAALSPTRAAELLGRMLAEPAVAVLLHLAPAARTAALTALDPAHAARLLARLPEGRQGEVLEGLDASMARELRELMTYPPDSAGGLMDPRVATLRPGTTAAQALAAIRSLADRRVHYLFLVDPDNRFFGTVRLQDVAVAAPTDRLEALPRQPAVSVKAMASQTEVVEVLEATGITALPVVDVHERVVGVIRHDALLRAAEQEASATMLQMVGVSKDERALSPVAFAVRRRLPWLNVNLLTAFLAASVVAIFEGTIAQFTALAVLLPVVAGQSGNTGAQALAVTMRALALREIRTRHWMRVALKEVTVGAVNGVAIALVTGAGVWVWSGSAGLAGVIAVAMVLSMVIAGLAGASVPVVLTLLKQDPAQASSIILTTVTDVVGFLSFLGLATLAAGLL